MRFEGGDGENRPPESTSQRSRADSQVSTMNGTIRDTHQPPAALKPATEGAGPPRKNHRPYRQQHDVTAGCPAANSQIAAVTMGRRRRAPAAATVVDGAVPVPVPPPTAGESDVPQAAASRASAVGVRLQATSPLPQGRQSRRRCQGPPGSAEAAEAAAAEHTHAAPARAPKSSRRRKPADRPAAGFPAHHLRPHAVFGGLSAASPTSPAISSSRAASDPSTAAAASSSRGGASKRPAAPRPAAAAAAATATDAAMLGRSVRQSSLSPIASPLTPPFFPPFVLLCRAEWFEAGRDVLLRDLGAAKIERAKMEDARRRMKALATNMDVKGIRFVVCRPNRPCRRAECIAHCVHRTETGRPDHNIYVVLFY